MAYRAFWDNDEKTILRQVFYDRATVTDYYQVNDECIAMMNEQPHTVDLILDVTDAKIDMTGFLAAIGSVEKKVPANQRLVVIVKANQFIQTMAKVASQFAKRATANVYFVDTLEEAYKLIKEYDANALESQS
jgi:hypothetical protein